MTELKLMKYATSKGDYEYYHLLSGQDLPIKTQKYIHEKCAKEPSILYLDYKTDINLDTEFGRKLYSRCSVVHYLQEYRTKSSYNTVNKIITFLDRVFIAVQIYIFNKDFVRDKQIPLAYGSNWFSLPQSIISYIIDNEKTIHNFFSKSSFCDELFIQTILAKSNKKYNISNNLRHIDFGRSDTKGHPYIWRNEDFKELVECSSFFARKFDENIDKEVIDKVVDYIK